MEADSTSTVVTSQYILTCGPFYSAFKTCVSLHSPSCSNVLTPFIRSLVPPLYVRQKQGKVDQLKEDFEIQHKPPLSLKKAWFIKKRKKFQSASEVSWSPTKEWTTCPDTFQITIKGERREKSSQANVKMKQTPRKHKIFFLNWR